MRATASGRSSLATSSVRGAPETERDVVDADARAEIQIVDILRRQRTGRQHDAWNVDPLVLAKRAAINNGRAQLFALDALHPQLNMPIVEQQRVAGRDRPRQVVGR